MYYTPFFARQRRRRLQVFSIPDGPSKSLPVAMDCGKGGGWQRFAIWIARRDGTVAALCPVVPQSAKVDEEELVSLVKEFLAIYLLQEGGNGRSLDVTAKKTKKTSPILPGRTVS